jgi:hypothetical protein
MTRSISRYLWLGLLGLIWFAVPGEGQAWDRPPVKVNTQFQFRIEVKVGPQYQRPTAPWYAYFPADPRLMPTPQATPFPPWPAQFPPPMMPPAGLSRDAQGQPGPANGPQGPMLSQYWPGQATYGANVQPVGYTPAQVPSYWYQGR